MKSQTREISRPTLKEMRTALYRAGNWSADYMSPREVRAAHKRLPDSCKAAPADDTDYSAAIAEVDALLGE